MAASIRTRATGKDRTRFVPNEPVTGQAAAAAAAADGRGNGNVGTQKHPGLSTGQVAAVVSALLSADAIRSMPGAISSRGGELNASRIADV